MTKTEITRNDGKKATINGGMTDYVFANMKRQNKTLVSYRVFDDGDGYSMTEKDKELKAHCEMRSKIEKAMSY
jgi:hypothetical protein